MTQQGYFDQCNDIISNLEETLSSLQLTVSDLHTWAFGHPLTGDGDPAGVSVKQVVPSRVMQNRLIDALEHATAILFDANEVQIFMMGGEHEGAPDDWVDDLQQSSQASPVKQAKPETLEAVEVARKILDESNSIVIGEHVVPAPMSEEPKSGSEVFVVAISSLKGGKAEHNLYDAQFWCGSLNQKFYLDSRVMHSSKEAAIAHAKALIAVSKGE